MELFQFNAYSDIPELCRPSVQRDLDPHRIGPIKDYIKSKLNEGKTVILGALILAEYNGIIYLIDGQHRHKAIKELYEESKISVCICAVKYKLSDKSDLIDMFKTVNNGVPVPQFLLHDPESEGTEKLKRIMQILNIRKGFDSKFKNRPNVNINDFMEELHKFKLIQLCVSVNDVLKSITYIEDIIKNWIKDSKYVKRNHISDTMLRKCVEWDNYLGLDKNYVYMNDEGVLHSVENMLQSQKSTNEEIKDIHEGNERNRHKWTTIERQQIWHTYIGAERGKIKCPLCRINHIEPLNYVVGHVVSLYNNGKDDISNVRPICNVCNNSMGSKNMDLNKYSLEGM
jgi:hypothetical protein